MKITNTKFRSPSHLFTPSPLNPGLHAHAPSRPHLASAWHMPGARWQFGPENKAPLNWKIGDTCLWYSLVVDAGAVVVVLLSGRVVLGVMGGAAECSEELL